MLSFITRNLIFVAMLAGAASLDAAELPLALVYDGPGSCEAEINSTGCTAAAAEMARLAGFEVRLVDPSQPVPTQLFARAAVYVQPGGRARIQEQHMSAELRSAIVDLVRNGGGYVGFCAGGFLAGERFGWMDENGPYEASGLGFVPGRIEYYGLYNDQLDQRNLAKIVRTNWEGQTRHVYWELGPYFNPTTIRSLTGGSVTALYPVLGNNDQMDRDRAMSAQFSYGQGRVSITAVHPEAPQDWRAYYRLNDPDGLDYSLAQSMIHWAAQR